jgi:hypothetical protein
VFIDDLDVVMVSGPVITNEQHPCLLSGLHCADPLGSVEETTDDLMVKCSPQTSRGTASQQPSRLLVHRQRHDLDIDLKGQ